MLKALPAVTRLTVYRGLLVVYFIPQLGLPKGVLTHHKNQWLGLRLVRGRFLGEPGFFRILRIVCYIRGKVTFLEVPQPCHEVPRACFCRLPGLVPQARIQKKLPLAFFRLALALSLALPLALQFNKNCLRHSLDLLEYCLQRSLQHRLQHSSIVFSIVFRISIAFSIVFSIVPSMSLPVGKNSKAQQNKVKAKQRQGKAKQAK